MIKVNNTQFLKKKKKLYFSDSQPQQALIWGVLLRLVQTLKAGAGTFQHWWASSLNDLKLCSVFQKNISFFQWFRRPIICLFIVGDSIFKCYFKPFSRLLFAAGPLFRMCRPTRAPRVHFPGCSSFFHPESKIHHNSRSIFRQLNSICFILFFLLRVEKKSPPCCSVIETRMGNDRVRDDFNWAI